MTKYPEVVFIIHLVGKTFTAFSNAGTGLKPCAAGPERYNLSAYHCLFFGCRHINPGNQWPTLSSMSAILNFFNHFPSKMSHRVLTLS